MSYVLLLQFFIITISLCNTCFSADGDLDQTFGTGGLVQTPTGVNVHGQANAVALQADGKIIAAGIDDTTVLAIGQVIIARYNTDGALDTSFGGTGIVTTQFVDVTKSEANGVAVQTDGKIVIAGAAGNHPSVSFALARYNTDGSLDSTFNGDGLVSTGFPDSTFSIAYAIIIQPDGKIVAVGQASKVTNDFALARYNTDGSLDTSFGTGGLVTTDFGGASDIAYAALLQPDGKIVAAGLSGTSFALARYNTDGSLDTTFGTGGLVTTAVGGPARGVGQQSDGKIVAGGASGTSFALARYNTDGSLDTTFGTSGTVTTSFGGTDGSARALVVASNDKLIATGYALISGTMRFALARYTADGLLDPSFGTDGKVTAPTIPSFGNGQIFAAVLQVDSKIVAAGTAQINGDFYGLALARYFNCPGYDLVGSDSVVTLFSTPQYVALNGRIAQLAVLADGFGLCDDATFDSCFPVVGKICLECNRLTLQKDLIMKNISYFGSLGDIVGNGHVLDLAYSVTTLSNTVCPYSPIAPITPCPDIEWGNITVSLNSDITLQDTTITFTGISTLIGNNNVLTLDSNSAIIVGADAQLTMKNITIEGVNGTKIQGINDQSHLILENATWILDGNYTFAAGYFDVVRDFYIVGQNYQFNYQTTQASTITTDSRFMIGRDITFRYSPAMSSKDLLLFADDSAQLVLKGGIFRASSTGVNLLKGMVRILNRSTLLGEGINTAQAISLGDGISSSNNLTVQINPAAQLVLEGPIVYSEA